MRPDECVTIMGQRGSGKSTVALGYVSQMPSAIVVDTKGEIMLPDWLVTEDPAAMGENARVIWRPPLLADAAQAADVAAYWAYRRGATCLYFDELGESAKQGRLGGWVRACYWRGRTRGVGVWGATVRPKQVDNAAFSEASWLWVALHPQLPAFDADKVAGFVGPDYRDMRQRAWDPFTWYVYRAGQEHGAVVSLAA